MMSLVEMIQAIHMRLKSECYTDLVEEIPGVSETTIKEWRKCPPEKPSLHVFVRLAQFCGLNPTIDQLEPLL